MVSQENRQIVGRPRVRHLPQHVADEAPVVSCVIDDMQRDFCARHRAGSAANEFESHGHIEIRVGPAIECIDVPFVRYPKSAPELLKAKVVPA